MDLIDESGEIRATLFKDESDKLYSMVEEGKFYYISKSCVKTSNKTYFNLENDLELRFTRGSEIELCNDTEACKIPDLSFSST